MNHSSPRIFAIASGKGGVGKTWFSITLAHAMARQGKKVLLFDGDFGLANIDIQLNLSPTHDLADVLAGKITLARAVQRHEDSGVDILSGRSGSGALANLPMAQVVDLGQQLQQLASSYDCVLIDIGAGVDRLNLHLASLAHTILVLVTDEQPSWMDGYAFIKKTYQGDGKADVRVVVNMVANQHEGEKSYQPIRLTAEKSLPKVPPLAGVVRRDSKVREAIKTQTALLTRSPNADAAKDVLALAQKLTA